MFKCLSKCCQCLGPKRASKKPSKKQQIEQFRIDLEKLGRENQRNCDAYNVDQREVADQREKDLKEEIEKLKGDNQDLQKQIVHQRELAHQREKDLKEEIEKLKGDNQDLQKQIVDQKELAHQREQDLNEEFNNFLRAVKIETELARQRARVMKEDYKKQLVDIFMLRSYNEAYLRRMEDIKLINHNQNQMIKDLMQEANLKEREHTEEAHRKRREHETQIYEANQIIFDQIAQIEEAKRKEREHKEQIDESKENESIARGCEIMANECAHENLEEYVRIRELDVRIRELEYECQQFGHLDISNDLFRLFREED